MALDIQKVLALVKAAVPAATNLRIRVDRDIVNAKDMAWFLCELDGKFRCIAFEPHQANTWYGMLTGVSIERATSDIANEIIRELS